MGLLLFDKYTYLHFATGVIAYFWNINIRNWIIIHTIFELLENTNKGITLIIKFYFWPGGKNHPDSFINIIGDTIGTILGWMSAYYLDIILEYYNIN